MKPEQIYQHLKELSEKLGITVTEQSFKQAGVSVKSGYCIVKDEKMFIMDKNISQYRKNRTLAAFLREQPLDEIYVIPAVRKLLEKK
ncbi:MAG: hypothetical protein JRH15_04750 [Deltaproteobacteria bacterium]|nr:hypothetical protein [Deltaproteobacteria bacterium]